MFQISLNVRVGVGVNLIAKDRYVGCLGHTLHAEQAGNQNTHLDCDGEIEYHCQEECYKQYDDIGLGVLEDGLETAPLTHVV